ncbi:hypothetical protein BESB_078850 [Besnoitia besnoiti]|uniref:AP2/ERF domain-containing protein n=1 Tax=Besnoitia besnoiti TaxID=94643 RepID=A0A2A9M6T6_BESBE|nr:hypothetical protein BESB_078850 [Besnoitia besnoiti]PFH33669.1 hypothetical protein BESB_078850 [Besnoitia besnoiti]
MSPAAGGSNDQPGRVADAPSPSSFDSDEAPISNPRRPANGAELECGNFPSDTGSTQYAPPDSSSSPSSLTSAAVFGEQPSCVFSPAEGTTSTASTASSFSGPLCRVLRTPAGLGDADASASNVVDADKYCPSTLQGSELPSHGEAAPARRSPSFSFPLPLPLATTPAHPGEVSYKQHASTPVLAHSPSIPSLLVTSPSLGHVSFVCGAEPYAALGCEERGLPPRSSDRPSTGSAEAREDADSLADGKGATGEEGEGDSRGRRSPPLSAAAPPSGTSSPAAGSVLVLNASLPESEEVSVDSRASHSLSACHHPLAGSRQHSRESTVQSGGVGGKRPPRSPRVSGIHVADPRGPEAEAAHREQAAASEAYSQRDHTESADAPLGTGPANADGDYAEARDRAASCASQRVASPSKKRLCLAERFFFERQRQPPPPIPCASTVTHAVEASSQPSRRPESPPHAETPIPNGLVVESPTPGATFSGLQTSTAAVRGATTTKDASDLHRGTASIHSPGPSASAGAARAAAQRERGALHGQAGEGSLTPGTAPLAVARTVWRRGKGPGSRCFSRSSRASSSEQSDAVRQARPEERGAEKIQATLAAAALASASVRRLALMAPRRLVEHTLTQWWCDQEQLRQAARDQRPASSCRMDRATAVASGGDGCLSERLARRALTGSAAGEKPEQTNEKDDSRDELGAPLQRDTGKMTKGEPQVRTPGKPPSGGPVQGCLQRHTEASPESLSPEDCRMASQRDSCCRVTLFAARQVLHVGPFRQAIRLFPGGETPRDGVRSRHLFRASAHMRRHRHGSRGRSRSLSEGREESTSVASVGLRELLKNDDAAEKGTESLPGMDGSYEPDQGPLPSSGGPYPRTLYGASRGADKTSGETSTSGDRRLPHITCGRDLRRRRACPPRHRYSPSDSPRAGDRAGRACAIVMGTRRAGASAKKRSRSGEDFTKDGLEGSQAAESRSSTPRSSVSFHYGLSDCSPSSDRRGRQVRGLTNPLGYDEEHSTGGARTPRRAACYSGGESDPFTTESRDGHEGNAGLLPGRWRRVRGAHTAFVSAVAVVPFAPNILAEEELAVANHKCGETDAVTISNGAPKTNSGGEAETTAAATEGSVAAKGQQSELRNPDATCEDEGKQQSAGSVSTLQKDGALPDLHSQVGSGVCGHFGENATPCLFSEPTGICILRRACRSTCRCPVEAFSAGGDAEERQQARTSERPPAERVPAESPDEGDVIAIWASARDVQHGGRLRRRVWLPAGTRPGAPRHASRFDDGNPKLERGPPSATSESDDREGEAEPLTCPGDTSAAKKETEDTNEANAQSEEEIVKEMKAWWSKMTNEGTDAAPVQNWTQDDFATSFGTIASRAVSLLALELRARGARPLSWHRNFADDAAGARDTTSARGIELEGRIQRLKQQIWDLLRQHQEATHHETSAGLRRLSSASAHLQGEDVQRLLRQIRHLREEQRSLFRLTQRQAGRSEEDGGGSACVPFVAPRYNLGRCRRRTPRWYSVGVRWIADFSAFEYFVVRNCRSEADASSGCASLYSVDRLRDVESAPGDGKGSQHDIAGYESYQTSPRRPLSPPQNADALLSTLWAQAYAPSPNQPRGLSPVTTPPRSVSNTPPRRVSPPTSDWTPQTKRSTRRQGGAAEASHSRSQNVEGGVGVGDTAKTVNWGGNSTPEIRCNPEAVQSRLLLHELLQPLSFDAAGLKAALALILLRLERFLRLKRRLPSSRDALRTARMRRRRTRRLRSQRTVLFSTDQPDAFARADLARQLDTAVAPGLYSDIDSKDQGQFFAGEAAPYQTPNGREKGAHPPSGTSASPPLDTPFQDFGSRASAGPGARKHRRDDTAVSIWPGDAVKASGGRGEQPLPVPSPLRLALVLPALGTPGSGAAGQASDERSFQPSAGSDEPAYKTATGGEPLLESDSGGLRRVGGPVTRRGWRTRASRGAALQASGTSFHFHHDQVDGVETPRDAFPSARSVDGGSSSRPSTCTTPQLSRPASVGGGERRRGTTRGRSATRPGQDSMTARAAVNCQCFPLETPGSGSASGTDATGADGSESRRGARSAHGLGESDGEKEDRLSAGSHHSDGGASQRSVGSGGGSSSSGSSSSSGEPLPVTRNTERLESESQPRESPSFESLSSARGKNVSVPFSPAMSRGPSPRRKIGDNVVEARRSSSGDLSHLLLCGTRAPDRHSASAGGHGQLPAAGEVLLRTPSLSRAATKEEEGMYEGESSMPEWLVEKGALEPFWWRARCSLYRHTSSRSSLGRKRKSRHTDYGSRLYRRSSSEALEEAARSRFPHLESEIRGRGGSEDLCDRASASGFASSASWRAAEKRDMLSDAEAASRGESGVERQESLETGGSESDASPESDTSTTTETSGISDISLDVDSTLRLALADAVLSPTLSALRCRGTEPGVEEQEEAGHPLQIDAVAQPLIKCEKEQRARHEAEVASTNADAGSTPNDRIHAAEDREATRVDPACRGMDGQGVQSLEGASGDSGDLTLPSSKAAAGQEFQRPSPPSPRTRVSADPGREVQMAAGGADSVKREDVDSPYPYSDASAKEAAFFVAVPQNDQELKETLQGVDPAQVRALLGDGVGFVRTLVTLHKKQEAAEFQVVPARERKRTAHLFRGLSGLFSALECIRADEDDVPRAEAEPSGERELACSAGAMEWKEEDAARANCSEGSGDALEATATCAADGVAAAFCSIMGGGAQGAFGPTRVAEGPLKREKDGSHAAGSRGIGPAKRLREPETHLASKTGHDESHWCGEGAGGSPAVTLSDAVVERDERGQREERDVAWQTELGKEASLFLSGILELNEVNREQQEQELNGDSDPLTSLLRRSAEGGLEGTMASQEGSGVYGSEAEARLDRAVAQGEQNESANMKKHIHSVSKEQSLPEGQRGELAEPAAVRSKRQRLAEQHIRQDGCSFLEELLRGVWEAKSAGTCLEDFGSRDAPEDAESDKPVLRSPCVFGARGGYRWKKMHMAADELQLDDEDLPPWRCDLRDAGALRSDGTPSWRRQGGHWGASAYRTVGLRPFGRKTPAFLSPGWDEDEAVSLSSSADERGYTSSGSERFLTAPSRRRYGRRFQGRSRKPRAGGGAATPGGRRDSSSQSGSFGDTLRPSSRLSGAETPRSLSKGRRRVGVGESSPSFLRAPTTRAAAGRSGLPGRGADGQEGFEGDGDFGGTPGRGHAGRRSDEAERAAGEGKAVVSSLDGSGKRSTSVRPGRGREGGNDAAADTLWPPSTAGHHSSRGGRRSPCASAASPLPTGVYFDASRKLWRCQWRENGRFKTKGFSLNVYKTLKDARRACVVYRCLMGGWEVDPRWLGPDDDDQENSGGVDEAVGVGSSEGASGTAGYSESKADESATSPLKEGSTGSPPVSG